MQKNLKLLGVIAILGASLAISGFAIQDVMAASGANKSVYFATEPTFIQTADLTADGTVNGTGIIATTTIKTANPTDVLILYNEECSLYTELNLKGKNSDGGGEEIDEVNVSHKIQLLVDGETVGPQITMCDRTYGIETNILNNIDEICNTLSPDYDELACEDSFLNTWINTKAAHGWNWVVVDLGNFGTGMYHTIQVEGSVVDPDRPENEKNPDPLKRGVVIGERSLIVIPTHLDVDAQ